MITLHATETFSAWLRGLSDANAQARIQIRLERLARGNPGDVKPVVAGVSELRIDYGPGYRVYFLRRGEIVIFLLCGGDKRTQARAIKMAGELEIGP